MYRIVLLTVMLAACSGGAANKKAESDSRCLLAKFGEKPDAEAICRTDCDASIGGACTTLGLMFHQGHLVEASPTTARQYVDRGCGLGDAVGCFYGGQLRDDGDYPALRAKSYRKACDANAQEITREDQQTACYQTASAYFAGHGVPASEEIAREYAEKACRLGSMEACEGQLGAPPQPATANAAPMMELTFGDVAADGLRLTDMSCRLAGGGMMAGVLMVGLLSKTKNALLACGAENDASLAWTAEGTLVTEAAAEGNEPEVNECLAGVVKSVVGMPDGQCTATLPVAQ